jgi:uroporphyrinogen-III synthase
MRILVTRPEPDASQLAGILVAAGHEAVVEPLMHIEFEAKPALDLAGVQGVLLTSANGARALAQATEHRDIPLYCVGAASAQQAADDGFTNITNAQGDVSDLAALVHHHCAPAAGPLVHVAGSVVAGDLAGQLATVGFETRREVLYRAVTATMLSDATQQLMRDGSLDAVMLFSPRTAKTFASLVGNAHLEGACAALDLLCLSQAVADVLVALPCRSVRVAERPVSEAIIALL